MKGHLWALSLNPVTSGVSVVLKNTHLTGEETKAWGSDLPRVSRLWIDYYERQREGGIGRTVGLIVSPNSEMLA